MQQRLFILSQYLLPHHLLSRLIGCAAECKASWFKSRLINWFAQQYQVNMSEAEVEQLDAYEHFNAFFTRALKPGARVADPDPRALLMPADGKISQAGRIEAGRLRVGDKLVFAPGNKTSTVKTIVAVPSGGFASETDGFDGGLDEAVAGQSVTLTLADEVDCSRGDLIAAAGDPPQASDQFCATFVWMDEEALKPGRGYWLKLGTQMVTATVQEPEYEIDVNSLEHLAAKTLGLNAIGVAHGRPEHLQATTDAQQAEAFCVHPGESADEIGHAVDVFDAVGRRVHAAGLAAARPLIGRIGGDHHLLQIVLGLHFVAQLKLIPGKLQ